MKRTSLPVLVAAVLLLCIAPARAEGELPDKKVEPPRKPFLWVIEGDPRIYLFGTVHVPDDRVLVFPEAVHGAIASADCVITEVAVGAGEAPEAQARRSLPAGKTLADVLPKDVVDRLHAFLEARGVAATEYDGLRPWVVALALQVVDLLPELSAKKPQQVAIPTKALELGKECAALETPEDRYAFYEKLSDAQQAKLVSATIDQLESAKKAGRDPVQELIEAYLAGDEVKVLAAVQEAAVTGDDDMKSFRTRMIDERTKRMVDRLLVEAQNRKGKTLFVAVGAAHFAGDAGIPALLAKRGLVVRRLDGRGDVAPATSAPAAPVEPKPTPPAPPPQPAPSPQPGPSGTR